MDFFLADGPCPQEGLAIPPDAVTLLPPASGWVA